MKKSVFLILPLLFLCSCNKESSSSLSSTSSGTESSSLSSSSSSSSSSSTPLTAEDFVEKLSKAGGHPNQIQGEQETSYFFSTGTEEDGITIDGKDAFTAGRYSNKEDGDLIVRKGVLTMDGSSTSYEMQTSYDEESFYQLLRYEDGTGTKQLLPFAESSIEANLSLDAAMSEAKSLSDALSYQGVKDVEVVLDLPKSLTDGETSFSYEVNLFVEGTDVYQRRLLSSTTITLEEGILTHIETTKEEKIYASGLALNKMSVKSAMDIQQGEFQAYDGEIFDPDDPTFSLVEDE